MFYPLKGDYRVEALGFKVYLHAFWGPYSKDYSMFRSPHSFMISQNWRSFRSQVRYDVQPLVATILGLPLRLVALYLPGKCDSLLASISSPGGLGSRVYGIKLRG